MAHVPTLCLMIFAEFCAFGFVASFEPGNHNLIRIAYLTVGVLSVAFAIRRVIQAVDASRRGLIAGSIGAIVGTVSSLLVATLLFLAGPRGNAAHPWQGLLYGVLLVPIIAVCGAWLGARRWRT